MVWGLLKNSKGVAAEAAALAQFADGRVAFAVGDIHGRADLLSMMLDTLSREIAAARRDGGDPVVVFLGDYVDRGPDSPRVIDLLLGWTPPGCERRYLLGNHDQSMLAFLKAPATNRAWLQHGGLETLVSYGVEPPWPRAPESEIESAAEALRSKLPPAHFDFLSRLERYAEYGDYLFVHAGVDPEKPLEQQTDDDLFWIRDRFTESRRPFSHRVVHGHTITDAPIADERRVGIDTGAYASGRLTAARFEGEAVSFLIAEQPARPRPSSRPIVQAGGAVYTAHGELSDRGTDMAQSGAHDDGMNIDDQRETFSGFMTATVWVSAHIAQAVALLTLAFAIGAGWWAGVAVYIFIGIAAGVLFKMQGAWWAAQIAQWVLLILGGLIVPALSGMMG